MRKLRHLSLVIGAVLAGPHELQQCHDVPSGVKNVYVLMQQSMARGAQLADDPQKVVSFDGRPADVHCNQKCCQDYDEDTFPCDVALTAIDMEQASNYGYQAQQATCFFLSCINAQDDYACEFADGSGPKSVGYGLYVTWINPNSKKTRHLLRENYDMSTKKLEEKNNISNNMTSAEKIDGEKEVQLIQKVANSTSTRLSEKVANQVAEYRQMAKEALASKRAITPLILIILGVSVAFVFTFLRYRKLKQHIRYDALKQNDYYSKLDPDDMAAEQEAQQLINGAYDI